VENLATRLSRRRGQGIKTEQIASCVLLGVITEFVDLASFENKADRNTGVCRAVATKVERKQVGLGVDVFNTSQQSKY